MQDSLDLGLFESEDLASKDRPTARKSHVRQERVFRQIHEEVLVPTDVRSLIDEDDSCLWIREGLKLIDLSMVRNRYQAFGGIAYDPLPMLGILLYAYSEGDSGSRTIEARCRRDICYMHVGYGQKPDDRTIRRFRRRIGPVLEEIFRLVLDVCKKHSLLPMRRVAVDGTKISSAASQLKHWLSRAEQEDVAEMGLEPPDCSDPDARAIKATRRFIVGYNCQAAVDCDSGVVMAVEVSNVSSDGHLLPPMARSIVKNAGHAPGQIVADAGYDTNEATQACQDLGIEPVIAQHDSTNIFWSVSQDDEILCPMGFPATPLSKTSSKDGKAYQVLRVNDCPNCVFFRECCPNSNYRTLSFPEGVDPIHRMNSGYRARSPEGRLAMRERMATIEPVFADIKANKGLDRFVLRGLAGARIEWTLIHIARNLKILARALRALLWPIIHSILAANLIDLVHRRTLNCYMPSFSK